MMTRRLWLTSLALLWIPRGRADSFEIKRENRIANGPAGYCAWASLETLAKHRGIVKLDGVTEKYNKTDGSATPEMVFRECQRRGVACHSWNVAREETLRDACDKKLGAVAGVRQLWSDSTFHAILVTGYDAEYVYYVDSNDVDWYYRAEWSWWRRHWTGWLVVLP